MMVRGVVDNGNESHVDIYHEEKKKSGVWWRENPC